MVTGTKAGSIYVDLQIKTTGLNRVKAEMNKSMTAIHKTVNKSTKGMQQSFAQQLKYMLSWQKFMLKIVHYISFSIGVQMVMAIRQGLENSIEIFKEFESAVVNAAAVSGYLGHSFDKAVNAISKLSRELASKTIFTMTEVAKAMYTVASAGIDPVISSTKELLPILQYATATQTNLEEAVKYVITVLKQFRLELDDTGMVVDTFTALITNSFMTAEKMANAFQYVGQIAGELNQDFREIGATLTLLADRGYEGAQAGQRLNMIFTKLLTPTDKGQRALAALGLTLSDIDPTVNSIVDILRKLKNAQFSVADASQMFRARTAAAAATLVSAVDEIEDYVLITKEMSGITEFIAEKQMDTMSGKFKQLAGDAQELGAAIGEELTGALWKLIESVKSLQGIISGEGDFDFFGTIKDMVKAIPFIGSIASMIDSALGMIDKIKGVQESLTLSYEAWEKLTKTGEDGMTVIQRYSNKAIPDWLDGLSRVVRIQNRLNELTAEGKKGNEEYNDLLIDLGDATRKYADSESDVLSVSSDILKLMHDLSPEVGDAVDAYTNLYNINKDINRLSGKQTNLNQRLIDTREEMNRLGPDREEEYNLLLNQANRITQDLSDVTDELRIRREELGVATATYNSLSEKLNENELAILEQVTDIINRRGELLEVQSELNSAMSEYAKVLDIVTNKEKYKAEAMLDVYELEDKLLKIELEKYKIAEDKKKLDDELFEGLAEQALLTEDIIEQYKEWKEAEGDLAKARAAYARGDITEAELQEYIDAATKEQKEYNDVAMDTAEHYMDIGIASNDVATTVTKIKDKANDMAQATDEGTTITYELEDAWLAVDRVIGYTQSDVDKLNLKVIDLKNELQNIFNLMNNINTSTGTAFEIVMNTIRNPGAMFDEFGNVARNLVFGERGGIFNSPTAGVFGEKGAEALVPLEGTNRKYGENIMKYLLSTHYSNLLGMQKGGVFGGTSYNRNVTYSGDTMSENYNMYGPINVHGIQDVGAFTNQLKFRYRNTR